jgi:drug/metabolite transporter (DMT)-like permease
MMENSQNNVDSISQSRGSSRVRDWGLLLLTNFLWASSYSVVGFVDRTLGPLATATLPAVVTTLMMIPIVRRERRQVSGQGLILTEWRDWWNFLVLALAGAIPGQLFLAWGIKLSLVSNAALISFALPVTTAVVAYIVLRERMTLLRWASFGVALVGVLQCAGINWRELNFTSMSFMAGNMLLFLQVTGSSFYNVYSKKLLRRYTPSMVLFYSYLASLPVLLFFTIYLEGASLRHFPDFRISLWLGILAIGSVNVFAMLMYLTVMTRLDATQAGLSNYLIPVFGVIVAAATLHERLSKAMILGGILVLTSTLLITVYDRQTAEEDKPAAARGSTS